MRDVKITVSNPKVDGGYLIFRINFGYTCSIQRWEIVEKITKEGIFYENTWYPFHSIICVEFEVF